MAITGNFPALSNRALLLKQGAVPLVDILNKDPGSCHTSANRVLLSAGADAATYIESLRLTDPVAHSAWLWVFQNCISVDIAKCYLDESGEWWARTYVETLGKRPVDCTKDSLPSVPAGLLYLHPTVTYPHSPRRVHVFASDDDVTPEVPEVTWSEDYENALFPMPASCFAEKMKEGSLVRFSRIILPSDSGSYDFTADGFYKVGQFADTYLTREFLKTAALGDCFRVFGTHPTDGRLRVGHGGLYVHPGSFDVVAEQGETLPTFHVGDLVEVLYRKDGRMSYHEDCDFELVAGMSMVIESIDYRQMKLSLVQEETNRHKYPSQYEVCMSGVRILSKAPRTSTVAIATGQVVRVQCGIEDYYGIVTGFMENGQVCVSNISGSPRVRGTSSYYAGHLTVVEDVEEVERSPKKQSQFYAVIVLSGIDDEVYLAGSVAAEPGDVLSDVWARAGLIGGSDPVSWHLCADLGRGGVLAEVLRKVLNVPTVQDLVDGVRIDAIKLRPRDYSSMRLDVGAGCVGEAVRVYARPAIGESASSRGVAYTEEHLSSPGDYDEMEQLCQIVLVNLNTAAGMSVTGLGSRF